MTSNSTDTQKTRIGRSWSESVSALNSVTKTNMILGVALVLSGVNTFFTEPVVVVVPSQISQEITIKGDAVSPSYKTMWGEFVATTMGNVNPRNVEFKIAGIQKLMSPRIRSVNSELMKQHAQKMKLTRAEEVFSIDSVHYSEAQDLVYAYGPKEIRSKGRKPIKSTWTYEMRIEAKNGSPFITYIKQYPGSPKNSSSKTYVVEDQRFSDYNDVVSMERPLTDKEKQIINEGGVVEVGDTDTATQESEE